MEELELSLSNDETEKVVSKGGDYFDDDDDDDVDDDDDDDVEEVSGRVRGREQIESRAFVASPNHEVVAMLKSSIVTSHTNSSRESIRTLLL